MARIEVTAANFRGSALQGAGADTLVLVGGGTFDFAYVTLSGFSEISSESGTGYASVRISAEQLAGITSFKRTNGSTPVYLTGSTINLSGKTFDKLTGIYIDSDNATVTVSNLSLALAMNAHEHQGETVVLNGPITTPTSRADLHARGFDKIVEGTKVWTDASPTLTGLAGDFHVRESESVRLDPEGDATISDAEGPIAFLDIVLSDSGYYRAMNNFVLGQNFKILEGSISQTLTYKGTTIATISQVHFNDGARIVFNGSATAEAINEFVRNLSYTPGDFVYEENVTITFTAYDEGHRKAETTLHVTAETNWTPTRPALVGRSVVENAAAGTIVGTSRRPMPTATP